MQHHQFNQILTRVLSIIGALVLTGLVLRLIAAILSPVLPGALMRDLSAGWGLLYGLVAPAMPPIMAVLILAAICWVILGRGR